MAIDAREMERLAALAGLTLTPAEQERLAADLVRILDYVGRLRDVGDPAAVDEPAVGDGAGTELRADRVEPWPAPGALLEQAPDAADGYFRSPRVV